MRSLIQHDFIQCIFTSFDNQRAEAAAPPVSALESIQKTVKNFLERYGFLSIEKGVTKRIMAVCGYKGVGGIGLKENGISTPFCFRQQVDEEGLGFHHIHRQNLILHQAKDRRYSGQKKI
jgi:hypothetical protein